MKSLDPRITRLKLPEKWDNEINKSPLDQFGTWEVFHQRKEGIPYTYVGPVHAPNQDMAFLFAKEQYSRRYTCSGLWIVNTQNIFVTEYTDSEKNIYDKFTGKGIPDSAAGSEQFEIFHLNKRGKQHVHACICNRSPRHQRVTCTNFLTNLCDRSVAFIRTPTHERRLASLLRAH